MEASEKPQLAFEGDPSGPAADAFGDHHLAEAHRDGDERVRGFARLHLMVNTVLDRLTRF